MCSFAISTKTKQLNELHIVLCVFGVLNLYNREKAFAIGEIQTQ